MSKGESGKEESPHVHIHLHRIPSIHIAVANVGSPCFEQNGEQSMTCIHKHSPIPTSIITHKHA